MALGQVSPMSGGLEQCRAGFTDGCATETPYEVGYMRSAQWGNEGEFSWSALPMASTRIYGRYPESEHRHPIAFVRNIQTGSIFCIQVAWSGGYHITLDVSQNLRRYHDWERTGSQFVCLGFEAGPHAPTPLRVLRPGETYETPGVHIGMVYGTLDDAVAENHAHARMLLGMNRTASQAYVEAALGPGMPYTDEYLDNAMRMASEAGADVFFIDAGWYAPPDAGDNWDVHLGDWEHRRFNRSIPEIRDDVHALGMKFGLWMEPERVSERSDAFRDHPERIATGYDGQPLGSRQLDISRSDVAGYIEDCIARVIGEWKLDFFRLDFNVGHLGEGAVNTAEGKPENYFARYYEHLYAMLSRLRSRFPDVIFENCASGGARTDLGILRYFDHTWVSDWLDPPRSFRILSGMTLALPPEYIDRFLFGNYGWRTGDADFELDLLLFARPTLSPIDTPDAPANPVLAGKLRNRIALYKEFVATFIANCRVYHHTQVNPGPHSSGIGILEYAASDKRRGMIGIFGLAGCTDCELCVTPKGLHPGYTYQITFLHSMETARRTGLDIMREGLPIIGMHPLASRVVLFEAVGRVVPGD
ncbi:MAG: alpha-galactosidase [Clostridiales bacterium]|nr:alpha-galactosidase [Clostridiales bacterium]